MAIGDVLSGDKVKLWIEDAGTIGTDLANEFQSEATSFDVSGGEIDYDSEKFNLKINFYMYPG